jgi:thiamine biosynthesis lipoprotein
MWTRLDVVMTGKESHLSEVWNHLIAESERLHRMLNRFDKSSEISHINSHAATRPVEVSDELWSILTNIKKYHHQTAGYFDISLCDFNRVILDDDRHTATFAQKDISLDLGGYAKGYALERIKKIFFYVCKNI